MCSKTVLSIFGCDRAWLAYPSDADGRRWRTVAQRGLSRGFADTPSLDLDLPMGTRNLPKLFRPRGSFRSCGEGFGAGGNPLIKRIGPSVFGRAPPQMCLGCSSEDRQTLHYWLGPVRVARGFWTRPGAGVVRGSRQAPCDVCSRASCCPRDPAREQGQAGRSTVRVAHCGVLGLEH